MTTATTKETMTVLKHKLVAGLSPEAASSRRPRSPAQAARRPRPPAGTDSGTSLGRSPPGGRGEE